MDKTKEILKIKDLRLKVNGSDILNGLNIDFWEGYIHAVIGPNGAGKTTLGFTIMGLEGYKDYKGDIIYKGEPLKDLDIYQRSKKGITLAWQEPARFEGLTVEQFILASAKVKKKKVAKESLEMMGMGYSEYSNRAVDKYLSGGERKKVELASIIAMEPELVILDEPDSGIDIASLENIFEAIGYLKDRGATIILITHSPSVLKQAEHAFLICNGEILEKGSVSKIGKYFENRCIPCGHKNLPETEEKK
jgi:Fe-S cluster assembly ATP-binding protein